MKERLISLYWTSNYFQIYYTFYVSTLKIEFVNISILIFFKNEESDKMSAESAPVQRTSGGELTNSLALSDPCSLTIDAKYVFISQI